MVRLWVDDDRSQKLVCTSRSSCAANRRCCWFKVPTGSVMTPLSEMAYSTVPAAFSTARPTIFCGIKIRSRTVRLSASMMESVGRLAEDVEPRSEEEPAELQPPKQLRCRLLP